MVTTCIGDFKDYMTYIQEKLCQTRFVEGGSFSQVCVNNDAPHRPRYIPAETEPKCEMPDDNSRAIHCFVIEIEDMNEENEVSVGIVDRFSAHSTSLSNKILQNNSIRCYSSGRFSYQRTIVTKGLQSFRKKDRILVAIYWHRKEAMFFYGQLQERHSEYSYTHIHTNNLTAAMLDNGIQPLVILHHHPDNVSFKFDLHCF